MTDLKNKRFTVNNPDRIEFLAELYFECKVKKVPRSEMAEKYHMPLTTIRTIFTKHINHLSHDLNDNRYPMFYAKVKNIADKENHAIDLVPPSRMVSVVITEQPKEPNNTPLLIQRMQLQAELAKVNKDLEPQLDFLLGAMCEHLVKLHDSFEELTDSLTVKEYRTKEYPPHFICKINVIIQRVNVISEQFEMLSPEDLKTDTALLRNAEIKDTLNTLTEKYNNLAIKECY